MNDVVAFQKTVDVFTDACNDILETARETSTWRRSDLHHLVYHPIRERYRLSANLVVQAIRRVARRKGTYTGSFKRGSVGYDRRTLSLKGEVVSLTTTSERIKVPLSIGNYQRHLLSNAKSIQGGQLVKSRRGDWYLHFSIRTDVPTVADGGRVIGVDLGQKVLATTSHGRKHGGGQLKQTRRQYLQKRAEVRSKLDTERSAGVKRLWVRLSGKERRNVRHAMHLVSRQLVNSVEPGDTLAFEDLTGLRANTRRKGKAARHLHNLWPYWKLRQFVTYKAALKGVNLVFVDARNTSKTCNRCGYCDRANRKTQALFRCVKCGFQTNADLNASANIAQRAGSLGTGCRKPALNLDVSQVNHDFPSKSPRL
ncbi:MAG: transposase [Trueperaceae bacterium]